MSELNHGLCPRKVILASLAFFFPPLCHGAAPVYFDLVGLIRWGLFAIILFVALLVMVSVAKSRTVKALALLGLSSYVAVPIVYSFQSHKIREKDSESFKIFTQQQQNLSMPATTAFDSLCTNRSLSKGKDLAITGFRILELKSLKESPVRGWNSTPDFFSAFGTGKDAAKSVVDAIEQGILQNHSSVSLEFVEENGSWKRYRFNKEEGLPHLQDANDVQASHGLVLEQVPTGYEQQYSIFGVQINVIELATNQLVAQNIGFIHDIYWGAHNAYSLFPGPLQNRCGYIGEKKYVGGGNAPPNYVATWLLSLPKDVNH